eukprot:1155797-Pelagomonas_calceolata.AAC.6
MPAGEGRQWKKAVCKVSLPRRATMTVLHGPYSARQGMTELNRANRDRATWAFHDSAVAMTGLPMTVLNGPYRPQHGLPWPCYAGPTMTIQLQ